MNTFHYLIGQLLGTCFERNFGKTRAGRTRAFISCTAITLSINKIGLASNFSAELCFIVDTFDVDVTDGGIVKN